MTKFLQEVRTTNEASWVVSWLTQTNPRQRRQPSLFLEKISITPDWIKISAPNFMERRIKSMQRWRRDQKLKPEVKLRDVIKWRFEACASISVTITDNYNNNNNNNAICIAQIRRKQQMGCGQCPKRKVFSLALNVSIDMSVNRKSFGRLFHTEGPWTEKPRSP